MRLTPALALALAAGFAVPVAGQAATPATVNTGVPTITGPAPPHPGDTLTCNPGTWIDAQSFSYTWTRDGVDLSRPSSAMYTVSDADLGTSLGCSVMGIGFSGSATGHSTATAKVTRGAPVNTAAPALSAPSPARAGDAISCSQGTWNGAAGYTYAWTRDGVAIAGQSAATYTATTADAGHAITCTVTATSPHGSTTLTATAVSVSALPDTTALLAKASGTGWKTAGTADKLGVYTLPLTPVDGWAVNCESLTPGGKAIDTIVGKVGCTKDAITLVPSYPAKGENTWKGELTLTHGAASIKAPINLTTTADQIPPADTAPPALPAPSLWPPGVPTCPTGSSVTTLSTGTVTQKQPSGRWGGFVVQFTGVKRSETYWTRFTLLNYESLLKAYPNSYDATFWQQREERVQQQLAGSGYTSLDDYYRQYRVPPPAAQTCTQDSTGATTTNPVLSTGNASLTADATGNGNLTITTVPRPADTKTSSSREATVAGAERTKSAKRLNTPVAIVLIDRVGKGKKARMKGITLQVIGLTNGNTRLKLRKRPIVGTKTVTITKNVTVNGVTKKVRTTVKVPKTITLSRHARLGIVMLQPIGRKLVPTLGMFPR